VVQSRIAGFAMHTVIAMGLVLVVAVAVAVAVAVILL
jgi:hypothetical protein